MILIIQLPDAKGVIFYNLSVSSVLAENENRFPDWLISPFCSADNAAIHHHVLRCHLLTSPHPHFPLTTT
jgi:hypothetical protein